MYIGRYAGGGDINVLVVLVEAEKLWHILVSE